MVEWLPKDVRKALGVSGDAEIVGLLETRLYWKKFSINSIHKAFAELEEMAPSLELDTVEGEDKYVDREYALRKIGVRGVG